MKNDHGYRIGGTSQSLLPRPEVSVAELQDLRHEKLVEVKVDLKECEQRTQKKERRGREGGSTRQSTASKQERHCTPALLGVKYRI